MDAMVIKKGWRLTELEEKQQDTYAHNQKRYVIRSEYTCRALERRTALGKMC